MFKSLTRFHVSQILDIKTETPELINALSTLSTIIDDNTPAIRRQLRSIIESRSLDVSGQFLSAAETVIKVSSTTSLLALGTPSCTRADRAAGRLTAYPGMCSCVTATTEHLTLKPTPATPHTCPRTWTASKLSWTP